LGVGVWGFGDWAQSPIPIPNPRSQSPIPNMALIYNKK